MIKLFEKFEHFLVSDKFEVHFNFFIFIRLSTFVISFQKFIYRVFKFFKFDQAAIPSFGWFLIFVWLNYLVNKAIKKHLILSQERLVNIFNFFISDDNNAVFWVIKYVLKQALRIDAITDQNLELFNPMAMKIEINHQECSQGKYIEKMLIIAFQSLILV